MMQILANELRIGNKIFWVHEEGEKVLTVDADTIARIDDYNKFPDKDEYSRGMFWCPIPLTPDILDKCGFEWDIFYQGFSDGRYVINIRQDGIITFAYGKRKNDEMQFIPYIKYLHQLQNLYWCLCGQEININLDPPFHH